MKHIGRLAIAVLACTASFTTATAAEQSIAVPALYDGRWTIESATVTGACPTGQRIEVRIDRGKAFYSAGNFTVGGGVSTWGAVQGTISNLMAKAQVTGQLDNQGAGHGAWRTLRGSLFTCTGTWRAQRTK